MVSCILSLAKSQSYSDGLVEIFKEYGDHLYSKGDYDGAIEQYKLTIGYLEPSYVIRRVSEWERERGELAGEREME